MWKTREIMYRSFLLGSLFVNVSITRMKMDVGGGDKAGGCRLTTNASSQLGFFAGTPLRRNASSQLGFFAVRRTRATFSGNASSQLGFFAGTPLRRNAGNVFRERLQCLQARLLCRNGLTRAMFSGNASSQLGFFAGTPLRRNASSQLGFFAVSRTRATSSGNASSHECNSCQSLYVWLFTIFWVHPPEAKFSLDLAE
ncbi:hypothetical protein F5877DRAFT_72822 [Lentinula edodes]|nr:hypothetical protein F5877DRAFT_72822 [Lentinula edodes]